MSSTGLSSEQLRAIMEGVHAKQPATAGEASTQLVAAEDVNEGKTYVCFQCDSKILSQNDLFVYSKARDGTVLSYICRPCNRLKGRIHTLKKQNSEAMAGFSELTGENRKTFYQKAQDMFGNALTKYMTETLKWVRTRKSSSKFAENGSYKLLADLEVLPRFARNPEALQKLVERSPKLVDPYTDETFVYLPEYSFSAEQIDEELKQEVREINGEQKVKNNPKEKADPVLKPSRAPKGLPKGIAEKAWPYTINSNDASSHQTFASRNVGSIRRGQHSDACV